MLFLRSAQSVRQTPYLVARGHLTGWTLGLEPASGMSGRLLSLAPPRELAPALFRQIFSRAGESLSLPSSAALPLVVQGEYDRALAGRLAPEALLQAARQAGLETLVPEPRCLVHRRVSEPGSTRQLFFVLFDMPGFERFRASIPSMLQEAGGNPAAFDPSALSPVLMVAGADADFGRWLPLKADPVVDCLAPIAIE